VKQDIQAYFSLVRTDFGTFLRQAFHELYSGKELLWGWHVDAIIHALEENLAGRQPRLIINLPPRHLKSFIVSVAWPAFLLGQDASLKIFCVSYSDELAATIARDSKRLVEAIWYRQVFPHVKLTKSTANEVVTDQGGYRAALSVHGSITGRGADLIIVDDPCKPEEAVSDKARMGVNEWFMSTLLSRRDDKLRSGLIVVMQRLHVNDLTGFIGERGGFRKIAFPAIAEHDEVIALRGGREYFRRRGEPLQPAREPLAVLEQMRMDVGSFNFAAQYQQSPKTPEGTLFKRKYFKLVDNLPRHAFSHGKFFISIDSALSTAATADFTAISVVCVVDGKMYVIMAERGRWEYEELKARVLHWIDQLARKGQQPYVLVEYAGSGIALSQFLATRGHTDRRFEIHWRRPGEDKVTRAAKVLNMFEAVVHLLNIEGRNGWVQPFLNEFMNFPNGANDDQVDSLVQLLHVNAFRCLVQMPEVIDSTD
jgi:predicted phage terminase large subunit-like protein